MNINPADFLTDEQKDEIAEAYANKVIGEINSLKFSKGKAFDLNKIMQEEIRMIFHSNFQRISSFSTKISKNEYFFNPKELKAASSKYLIKKPSSPLAPVCFFSQTERLSNKFGQIGVVNFQFRPRIDMVMVPVPFAIGIEIGLHRLCPVFTAVRSGVCIFPEPFGHGFFI